MLSQHRPFWGQFPGLEVLLARRREVGSPPCPCAGARVDSNPGTLGGGSCRGATCQFPAPLGPCSHSGMGCVQG